MKPYRLPLSVVAACSLAGPLAAPAAEAPLETRLERALAVPQIDRTRTAAVAIDLRSGELVYARNPGRPLAPASTAKLAVSYAGLVRLGPEYRIETQLLGEGFRDATRWQGDLVLKGYGDPTLSKWDLKALARRVRAQGIRRVTGAVVADESYFDARRVAPGWKSSYYIEESPPLSALVVDRARFRGRTSTRPALRAAERLHAELRAVGVRVARRARLGRASDLAEPLARTLSPPLAVVLKALNRDSDNFAAELLLKHLGAYERGKGTSTAGAAVVLDVLREAAIPIAGVRIADGSGLSLYDRLTAQTLAGILVASWDDPDLRGVMLASLAVSGRSGTLEPRLRGPAVAGRVFAKTGTTALSSALAGYVSSRYVFAVLHNGSPVAWQWARVAQDNFVKVLATSAG